MPMQVQLNNMEFCVEFIELDRPCPTELMLISQVFCLFLQKWKLHSMDLKGNVFKCQQTWKKFKPFHQGRIMKSTWFLLF